MSKVKQIGSGKPRTDTFISMPVAMRNAVQDKTINQCLADGSLTDVADNNGVFAVPHADPEISTWYALFGNVAIGMSKAASELAEDGKLTDDIIGEMKFQKGISNQAGDGNGKEWFNLGLGGTLNLDVASKDSIKLGAEPVNAKA